MSDQRPPNEEYSSNSAYTGETKMLNQQYDPASYGQQPYNPQAQQSYGQPPYNPYAQAPYQQPSYGQPPYPVQPPPYQPGYGQLPPYSVQPYGYSVPTLYPYASYGSRFVAYLLDWLLLIMILFLVIGVLALFVDTRNEDFIAIGTMLCAFTLLFSYFCYFWTQQGGQTLGQKLMKIRVIRRNGQPLSLGRAIARVFGYWVNGFVFSLGWLWPLWDEQKQGWHDKIADTVVVRA